MRELRVPSKVADVVPKPSWYPAHARGAALSARLGAALGVSFSLCFLTGLISHLHQHPGLVVLPPEPVWAYAVSQGVHVTSGIASIPLLAVKLWSVAPRFWRRPLIGDLRHQIERLSVLVLVASAIFELVTGLLNVAEVYVFGFYFPPVHFAVAFLAIGSILVHVGVQLPKLASLLGQPLRGAPRDGMSRRDVLVVAGVGAVVAGLATAGDKLSWLRPFGVLSQRSGAGPEGIPVNRTAAEAGAAQSAGWTLTVVGADGAERRFTLEQLQALPQYDARLPIACVEGWNSVGEWSGVRLRDLVVAGVAGVAGGAGGAGGVVRAVTVRSVDTGLYGSSEVEADTVAHPETLIALRLGGQELSLDHGYPARLIAPNRPGVQQTKWVNRIEVRA